MKTWPGAYKTFYALWQFSQAEKHNLKNHSQWKQNSIDRAQPAINLLRNIDTHRSVSVKFFLVGGMQDRIVLTLN